MNVKIIDLKKFLVLSFSFSLYALSFALLTYAYALNIDKVKINFLEGDYQSAILEGEKILANNDSLPESDELYYVLGLCYLKDGNYLRASDIFEIIIKEFDDSAFKEEAKLGLGDTYFLRGYYDEAQIYYKELLDSNPKTKLKPAIYYRISQALLKEGDTERAKKYLDGLKKDFPANLEARINNDLYSLTDIFYTVQVGSFTKPINAKNFCNKLINEGYDAYIEESGMNEKKIYRVRVGKLKLRKEAEQLKNKLSSKGYPTKIFP
ncbi:MAG: tetratricopeptide repeat protein [Candidatus Omnitrophica bacterium]|nr:tetratricopeptide repeat protein [Candidatus Omnitrophota bacterium]